MKTKQNIPLIQSIAKDGPHHFQIQWTNGQRMRYSLSALQRHCPCASCYDMQSSEQRLDPCSVPEQQTAKRLQSVGRYALRIDFSSGCSNGIYDFETLYRSGEALEC